MIIFADKNSKTVIMKDRLEDTPPPSPGIGSGQDDDDELFEDQIEEEVDILDGEAEVSSFDFKSRKNVCSYSGGHGRC